MMSSCTSLFVSFGGYDKLDDSYPFTIEELNMLAREGIVKQQDYFFHFRYVVVDYEYFDKWYQKRNQEIEAKKTKFLNN